jgi:hypothetical protein
MYIFFEHNYFFFLIACFLNSSSEVTFQVSLILWSGVECTELKWLMTGANVSGALMVKIFSVPYTYLGK